MRILHLCLSCFYIDNFAYQENILPKYNKNDGHDVKIITSTETYGEDRTLEYVEPSEYTNEDGIVVVRLPYRRFLPHKIMRKLRMYQGVYGEIEKFAPDVILFHGLCAGELLTVVKYKKAFPGVKLYVDSHEDAKNSARSFLSKELLHRQFYRRIIKKSLQYFEKVLYVTPETKLFDMAMYSIPELLLEFFPLGGSILDDSSYSLYRKQKRKELGLGENDIMVLQAGKLEPRKKVLYGIKEFVRAAPSSNLKLFLIGSVDESIRDEFFALVGENANIKYLGWKEHEELMQFLCAADVYLQPGSQSAIMQSSLCMRCAVILDDVLSHEPYVQGNGWLINGLHPLEDIFRKLSLMSKDELRIKSDKSFAVARELLDYKELAQRLYV